MPRASTSAYTLDSPGFRKSTPRRAAAQRASTNIASTSAQLLQTAIELNGKGKERAATQDGGIPFEMAPELARGRSRREGKRGTEDQQEKSSKRRKVTADQRTGASNIQYRGSQPSLSAQEPSLARKTSDQADGGTTRPPRKKRTKKHVRIAPHTIADPSDGETSTYQPSTASDSDSDDAAVSRPIGRALANSTAAALAASDDDRIDWADPLSIPTAQPFRSRRYWQWLELGICHSAVHDVARDESHLGRALVEWELLRQHRAAEEALARPVQSLEDGEAQPESSRAGSAALDTPHGSRIGTPEQPAAAEEDDVEEEDATPRPTKRPRQRRADISLPSHDPNRALTPFPVTRATAEQLEVDENGVNLLPLPSAVALAKMARWPVHSSLVQPPSEGEAPVAHSPDSLEEALLGQYERFARRRDAATLPALAPLRATRAPSAYAPGGPFEREQDGGAMQDDSGTGSDSDSSDELDNLEDDDDDLLLEPESLPPSMTSIPPTIDRVLLRLLDLVPKSPLPAYDYWAQRTRTEELLKDDKQRGFVRDECAPGWEEVLAIAREMELPAHVVDELETQLVSLFGAPSRGTTRRLPSPGLTDKFVVRVHPRSSKAVAAQDDDDEGPTSPAPSSAAGDADLETANRRSARSTPAPRTSTSPAPSSDAARVSDSVEDERAAPRARGGRRGPPRDRTAAAAAGAPQPRRVYKPYVYSEAQRARKAAYKRERRRREKEQRDAASAAGEPSSSMSAADQGGAGAALVTE